MEDQPNATSPAEVEEQQSIPVEEEPRQEAIEPVVPKRPSNQNNAYQLDDIVYDNLEQEESMAGKEPVFQKAQSEQHVKTGSTTAEEIAASIPVKQQPEEEQKHQHALLGVSNDEIEADRSLSGGNLSASERGVSGTLATDEEVLKKIYQSNHCTTATYKLENTDSVQVLDQLPKSIAQSQINEQGANDLQMQKQDSRDLKQSYSAGDLKSDEVPTGLSKDDQAEIRAFNDKVLRSSNTQIISIQDNNRSNEGSLLRLFKCQYFNIHMLMTYLETKEQEGVIAHLINKLYDTSLENLDLYLPQLCYLVITKESEECARMLQRFILWTSIENPNIGLRALHYFQSWSEDKNASYTVKAMEFYNLLESTLVNQNLPKQFQVNNRNSVLGEFNMAIYEDKRHKADYISLQLAFMSDLTHLSLRLKDPSLGKDKTNFLFKELRRINEWIETNVRKEAAKVELPDTKSKFRGGIVFPMKIGDDKDPFVILGNIPELSGVFETKARAPYKIVFEVCRLSDLIHETLVQQKAEAGVTDLDDHNENEDGDKQPAQEATPASADHQEERKGSAEKISPMLGEEGEGGHLTTHVLGQQTAKKDGTSKVETEEEKKEGATAGDDGDDNQDILLDTMQTEDDHMGDNPFGLDTENDDGDGKEGQNPFSEVPLEQPKNRDEEVKGEEEQIQMETANNHDVSDEELGDWTMIEYEEAAMNLSSSGRQPDFMNDPFKDKWKNTVEAYTKNSVWGTKKTYSLKPMMVKANDDCRQEVMAMQLIKRLQQLFRKTNHKLYLRPYEIIITSSQSAMIEFMPDTISVNALKKKMLQLKEPQLCNLRNFYMWYFGSKFEEAQTNFIQSLAGYSIFTYLFAIKDRHNGNIMIDRKGHLIHIDFGFMLQNSPGNMGFEGAPFKLTAEYIDLMDGVDSALFEYFKSLITAGLLEIRKNMGDLIRFITIMMKDSVMPCFKNPETIVSEFESRMSVVGLNSGSSTQRNEMAELADRIVKASTGNFFTNQYDNFQKMTLNIEK